MGHWGGPQRQILDLLYRKKKSLLSTATNWTGTYHLNKLLPTLRKFSGSIWPIDFPSKKKQSLGILIQGREKREPPFKTRNLNL